MTRATALASIRYHCKDCGANNMISGPEPKCWLCQRPLHEFKVKPRPEVSAVKNLPQPPPLPPGSGERPLVKRSPAGPTLVAIAMVLVVFGLWNLSVGLGLLLGVCLSPGLILAIIEANKRSRDPYAEAGAPTWIAATATGVIIAVVVPILLAVAAVVALFVICSQFS
jgi:hypothetical protein